MTPTFDPSKPNPAGGLFRPSRHVLNLPQGSALAILDLERGVSYALTPVAADSWRMLVGDTRRPSGSGAEPRSRPDPDEDPHDWVRVAAFLLDSCVIEPAG